MSDDIVSDVNSDADSAVAESAEGDAVEQSLHASSCCVLAK